jgi:dihydroorotase
MARPELAVGDRLERLELEEAWLVDPGSGREGPASLLVENGTIVDVDWARRRNRKAPSVVVAPGLADLHAHLREPGGEDAETIASGLAAAAHGGFTSVWLMPNTTPPIDRPEGVAGVLSAVAASGSPLRVMPYGTISEGREGHALSPMAALAAAGVGGFSDDGAPVDDPELLRAALTEAGALGLAILEHAEDRSLTAGSEANEGLPATILGLAGAPPAAEAAAVGRAVAVLRQVVAEAPAGVRPRLHLTHVSTADALVIVRGARAEGLPLTCDVTPHHLALHDGWLGGDRRFAWEVGSSPWSGGRATAPPYDPATRVNPPLRSPADALALLAGIEDGTVDAIATDHAPHRSIDKDVPFGEALPGISGLETALSLVLLAIDAGYLSLATAIRALVIGPLRVLGGGSPERSASSFKAGSVADLVVFDRAERWTVTAEVLRSKGRNTPLLGRQLPGRVLLTVARGRVAYLDPGLD